MLNWLQNAIGWAGNALDDVKRWIVGLFSTVYSYFDGWIGWLSNEIVSVWNGLIHYVNILVGYIEGAYNTVSYWVSRIYHDIPNWVTELWNQLWKYIQDVWQWTSRLISYLQKLISKGLNDLANWVINNIWKPLYDSIAGLARWITTDGYQAYYLVTHPDQLALMIGRYVLGAWLGLGRRYASTIARWIIHTMISAAHDIEGLMEDFLAGIL